MMQITCCAWTLCGTKFICGELTVVAPQNVARSLRGCGPNSVDRLAAEVDKGEAGLVLIRLKPCHARAQMAYVLYINK